MTVRFTDTFYYIGILSKSDADHERAVALSAQFRGSDFVTTDAVLIELLAYFAERGPAARQQAAGFVRDLRADPTVTVIPVTRRLFDRGLEFYARRLDKGYSLTDCISMDICKTMRITQVLTGDHHFAQEGFTILFH